MNESSEQWRAGLVMPFFGAKKNKGSAELPQLEELSSNMASTMERGVKNKGIYY